MAKNNTRFGCKDSMENPRYVRERVFTGIGGLDKVICGGFPVGSFILLSGTCGTGKSIFGMQFLMKGAEKGIPGVYFSMEEEPKRLLYDMCAFDWDPEAQVKKGMITIAKPEVYESDEIRRLMVDTVERTGAKRLVIDSLSLISSYLENPFEVRQMVLGLSREVKKLNCTTLAVSDMIEGGYSYSTNGFEEFVADGVVVLSVHRASINAPYTRALLVRKMRATGHSMKTIPFKIDKKGIKLYEGEI